MANTVIYKTDYETKLQERLDYPQNWKEICDVRYTNGRVLEYNYMSTVPASQSHTRGSAMTPTDWAVTQEYITINQSRAHATYIDFADMAQQKWVTQMSLADLAGTILSEYVETDMLANHGMWTNFGNDAIGGAAGNITVDSTTIPKIMRGMKREIREANGMKLAKRNGMFIVWRAADFEVLEAYMQANGFNVADRALVGGAVEGTYYFGIDHYVSNSHSSGHLFGGVKRVFLVGLCRDTWGRVYITEVPAQKEGGSNEAGPLSGVLIHERLDWEFKAWELTDDVLFDILVA